MILLPLFMILASVGHAADTSIGLTMRIFNPTAQESLERDLQVLVPPLDAVLPIRCNQWTTALVFIAQPDVAVNHWYAKMIYGITDLRSASQIEELLDDLVPLDKERVDHGITVVITYNCP